MKGRQAEAPWPDPTSAQPSPVTGKPASVLVLLDGDIGGDRLLDHASLLAELSGRSLHVLSVGDRLQAAPEAVPLGRDSQRCPHDTAALSASRAEPAAVHVVPQHQSISAFLIELLPQIACTAVVHPVRERRWPFSGDRLAIARLLDSSPVTLYPVDPQQLVQQHHHEE